MSALILALPTSAAVLWAAAAAPPRDVDDVAAFARLYGVVRFFYPSDAAAELDWNRDSTSPSRACASPGTTAAGATTWSE